MADELGVLSGSREYEDAKSVYKRAASKRGKSAAAGSAVPLTDPSRFEMSGNRKKGKKRLTAEQERDVQELKKEKGRLANLTPGNIMWLLLAAYVVQTYDVADAVIYDKRAHREYLRWSAYFMGAATACAIFAAWFLEKLRGIDYEKEYPFLVPISCVTGILSGVCFWIGMWPVWGWMSFFIIPVLFMGSLIALIIVA